MNKKIIRETGISILLCILFSIALSACGSKEKEEKEETTLLNSNNTTVSLPEITYPVATETTPPPLETLPSNNILVAWDEPAVEGGEKIMVVSADSLRVRLGPSTTYDQIAELTKGMRVRVVATANSNWYKLAEGGYYVSGDFLEDVTP